MGKTSRRASISKVWVPIGRANLASIYLAYSMVSPSPFNTYQLIYGINFDAITQAIILTNMGNLAPSVQQCSHWLPIDKIISSLALPTNFVHISPWPCSFLATKASVPFPPVADFVPVLALGLALKDSFGEYLLSPLGLFNHSPLKQPFAF